VPPKDCTEPTTTGPASTRPGSAGPTSTRPASAGPDKAAEEPYAGLAETHSAVVFFAGDRAYKLKKPVRTGFLDFSTTQARATACQRETELNRRFAPDVYLGVAQVRDPAGQVCDHLVIMRRMPASLRLSTLIEAGRPAADAVRQVARILAAQHSAAPRSKAISEQGSRDALRQRWADNVEQARTIAEGLIEPADIDAVERLAGRFLAGRSALLEARVRGGRIVDGHGDLLAADIFCLADGPRILDCLEFDDKLRWLDGLDDAAFLSMDLERLGADDLAGQFLDWYVEFSGDPAPTSLRHHYVAYRAFVRAKVGCLRARQGDRLAGQEARQLAALTLRHLQAGAVTIVLVGGLPGTGKSALAGALADRLGWTVLSSDRIRKELADLPAARPAHAGYRRGIYAPSVTKRTYAELVRRAAELASHGESVILDATWVSAEYRAVAAAMADRTAADLFQLRCAAPAAVTEERIRRRTDGLSDAYPEVAARMAQTQAPWPEAVTIDTAVTQPGEHGGYPADLLRQVLGAVGRPETGA
jgi:uncharacterized protein